MLLIYLVVLQYMHITVVPTV